MEFFGSIDIQKTLGVVQANRYGGQVVPKPADTVMTGADRGRYGGRRPNRNDRTQRMLVFLGPSQDDTIGRGLVGPHKHNRSRPRKGWADRKAEEDRLAAICQMLEARFDAAQRAGPWVQIGNQGSSEPCVGLWIVRREDRFVDSGNR